jgi:hypothetical protein
VNNQPKNTFTIYLEGKEITINLKRPLPNDLQADLLRGREAEAWFTQQGGPFPGLFKEALAKATKVLIQGIEPFYGFWHGGGQIRLCLLFTFHQRFCSGIADKGAGLVSIDLFLFGRESGFSRKMVEELLRPICPPQFKSNSISPSTLHKTIQTTFCPLPPPTTIAGKPAFLSIH